MIKKDKPRTSKDQEALLKNWEKYRGSIVLTVDDQIYSTKQPKKVSQMIKEIERKHHKRPLITVVPKDDTLILYCNAGYISI